jgi:hypothetical protein
MALIDTIYKFLGRSRIGFSYAFTVFVMLFSGINPVLAQEVVSLENFDDPYLVQNIEADASAGSAVEAREKAFEAAQIAGYEELVKRFLSEEEQANFETPGIDIISLYVQDFEVTNEQLSATRYKGTYNIRFAENTFNQPNIDGLYDDNILMQQAELLVVPFLEINNRYYLWQINPFWEAWKRAQSNNVLGKIIVPSGSRDDVISIRDGQNLNYDPTALNAMQVRYQANQVVIAVARPEPLSDNTLNIAVSLYKPQPYGPELSRQLSVRSYPGEMVEQLYNRVVSTISQTLHSQWSRETAVPQEPVIGNNPDVYVRETKILTPSLTGAKNSIIAQFQFTSAREWVETKKAIESINGVETVQIRSLSSNSATIELNFLGNVSDLRSALNQKNIRLNNAPEGAIYQLTSIRR